MASSGDSKYAAYDKTSPPCSLISQGEEEPTNIEDGGTMLNGQLLDQL